MVAGKAEKSYPIAEGGGVTLFTIQLEVGPETWAMVERVASNALVQVELGPRTRGLIESLVPKESREGDGVQGLLRKGAKAARGS
jgi:hypothetical protein